MYVTDRTERYPEQVSATVPTAGRPQIVLILASLGGRTAVSTLLGGLPADFPVPLVFFQHRAQGFDPDPTVGVLQRHTKLPVVSARPGEVLVAPGVSVVPSGWGATVSTGGVLELTDRPPEGGGDELLASAAESYGPGVTAVVLTGKLADGARGVQAVKRRGGRVLVQELSRATAPGMPSSAMATGCVDFVLPLERLACAVVALTVAPGGAELLAVSLPSWASLVS